jgi:hypothetical protein
MLFKHVAPQHRTALSTVYIWIDTGQKDKLRALESHFGLEMMSFLTCAYVCDSVQQFEKQSEISQRSAQHLLPFAASMLDHYIRKNNLL